MQTFMQKVADGSAHISVIGLGYVGLPLAIGFAQAGYQVTGIDTDPHKVTGIQAGVSHVQDICSEELQQVVHSGHLRATQDFGVLAEVDSVSICVPTPLSKSKDPDISYIVSVTDEIRERLHPGQLIVLESTTYPGTTDEVVLPRLASTGLQVGRDFCLAFSPSGQYAQDSGRGDAAVHASSDAPLSANHRQCGAREFQPRRRNGQTAGKYVSSRQYWSRQRSGPDVCAPRPQCVGSDRCRGHETFRLHAILSWTGIRGTLYSARSTLPGLETQNPGLSSTFY